MKTTAENKMATPHALHCRCDGCVQYPSREPDPAADDRDANAARKAAERAQTDFDRADAAWIDAVSKHRSIELKARSQPMVMTFDGQPIEGKLDVSELAEAKDAAETAWQDREKAGRRLTDARRALRDAETAARRRTA